MDTPAAMPLALSSPSAESGVTAGVAQPPAPHAQASDSGDWTSILCVLAIAAVVAIRKGVEIDD